MAPTLPPLPNMDGVININSVRETLRHSLQKVCQEFDDNAVLLIDENICEPMLKSYLGTPNSAFAELNLPIAHVQPLSGAGFNSTTTAKILQHLNTVIIVRNNPTRAQLVAQHILEIQRLWEKSNAGSSAAQPSFWIAVYPELGLAFQRILSLAGVSAVTKVSEMPLHYFPFDKDVLSMHRPEAVKELLTDSNPAILSETARALVAFASTYGMPERIQAVGYHSCVVADLVRGNLLDLEASVLPGPLQEKTMARWIIFDRCTDLLTPLMSQLTLEGRLDEITDTGARTGWLPPERDSDVDSRVAAVKVLLHSSTPEWTTWRERHVQALSAMLAHTQQLKQKVSTYGAAERWVQSCYMRYLERPLHHLTRDMTDQLAPGGPVAVQHDQEMDVLENRGRGLNFFGASATSPSETLLMLVLSGAPLQLCLRRLLLIVMMRGALSDAIFQECVAVLLDAFGAYHIHSLTALEAAGLLTRKSTQKDSDTDSSSAAMRLLFDKAERGGKDVLQLSHLLTSSNEASGSEPSEPYGRYHAISSLLIRQAMDSYVPMWVKNHLQACTECQGRSGLGSTGFATYPVMEKDDPVRLLPEKHTLEKPMPDQPSEADKGKKAKPVLVVMLGGCTFAEMTALKAALHKKHGLKPIILTSDILTGDRFINTFIPSSTKLAAADALATMTSL